MKSKHIDTDTLDDILNGAIVLEPRSTYDEAIIGTSQNEKGEIVAVYGSQAIVNALMKHDKMSEEDALDWLSYNTLRALPYMGERHPIVIDELPFETPYQEKSDEDDVL